MCGELEEEAERAEEFYARFVAHAHSLLHSLQAKGKQDEFTAYLNGLFRETLLKAADHTKVPDSVSGYDRLAMEPLVFARIAGFMAAHMPLSEDPLRRVLEALMTGYAEGEIALPTHDHDHEHDHDHDHGHGHSHGHSH
jgi:hypothetical protein